MNLGLIREHISKSLLNNDNNKVKSFLNEIKNDKYVLEEMYVYGLIESLTPNQNINFMIKECIDALNTYDGRKNKIKKLFKNFHNPNYVISESNGRLYDAISTLIDNKYTKQSSKKVLESYGKITEHINLVNSIKSESIVESCDIDYKKLFKFINKNINESCGKLDEKQLNIIQVIMKGDINEKLSLFEEMKTKSLDMLESLTEDDMDLDIKEQSISKIKEMESVVDKLDENILLLVDLLD